MITQHRLGRFLPRAGIAAAILALACGQLAQAQTPQPDPGRLVIKAEANEKENGFCSTVNWPKRTTLDDFYDFLNNSRANSMYLSRALYEGASGCSYYRAVSVSGQGNDKCVQTMAWACFDAGDCNAVARKWCREPDGTWNTVK